MGNPRTAKVGERIHEIVASLVNTRVKDPRLAMVTITDVRVTGDLQNASIFYTVYGSEKERADAARGFASAKGMIRSHVGKQLGLRLTPELEFILDALPETAKSFEDALIAARHRDEEIAQAAEGKTYAGDANPYKEPRESEPVSGEESEL